MILPSILPSVRSLSAKHNSTPGIGVKHLSKVLSSNSLLGRGAVCSTETIVAFSINMFTIGIHLSRAPSGALWLSSVDPVSTRLVSYTSKCEREDARTALSRTTDSSATFSWCSGRGGGGGGALVGSADSLTKTVANTGVAVNIEEFPRSAGIGAF